MRQAKPNTKSILQIAKRQTVETETLHSTCALEDWATILLVWFCMFYDVVSNAIQSGSKQWVIRWSSVRNQTSNLLTNFGFNKSTTLKVWSYWMSLGVINQLTTEGGEAPTCTIWHMDMSQKVKYLFVYDTTQVASGCSSHKNAVTIYSRFWRTRTSWTKDDEKN